MYFVYKWLKNKLYYISIVYFYIMSFKQLDEIYNLLQNENYSILKNNYNNEDINCVLRLKFNRDNNFINKITLVLKETRPCQNVFKNKLVKKFNCCPISKMNNKICEAAHILPFSICNDEQKYDINNGILLSSNLHKAYDKGYFIIDEITCKIKINYNILKKDNINNLDEIDLLDKNNYYIEALDTIECKKYLKMHNKHILF